MKNRDLNPFKMPKWKANFVLSNDFIGVPITDGMTKFNLFETENKLHKKTRFNSYILYWNKNVKKMLNVKEIITHKKEYNEWQIYWSSVKHTYYFYSISYMLNKK